MRTGRHSSPSPRWAAMGAWRSSERRKAGGGGRNREPEVYAYEPRAMSGSVCVDCIILRGASTYLYEVGASEACLLDSIHSSVDKIRLRHGTRGAVRKGFSGGTGEMQQTRLGRPGGLPLVAMGRQLQAYFLFSAFSDSE